VRWTSLTLGVILTLFRSGVRQRVRGNIGGLEDYAQAFERLAAPLLVVAGRYDDLAPPESVRPAYVRSSSPDKTYRVLGHGHLDMLVGRFAPQTTWPLLEGWLAKRARV
jgi:polyhydroxyalkanoate synthase